MEEQKMYTIREVCEKTGLTAHTLRYYEKEKLLPSVGRSAGGFRQYSDEDMEKLAMICCLKNTGMSLQEIAQFMALAREGDSTLQARCEMLKKHRESVLERMEEMQRYLDKVTRKYDFYSKRLIEYEQQQKSLQNS
ncbi:MAG: MerR family transcriptional regulator [Clostridia bacterium]|nr:MerR family transcriptional regulator [Clostridia bacterium]